MEHVSLARFGQREDFCTLRDRAALLTRMAQDAVQPCADKWSLFARLRVARSHYGLSDRDLTVLNALLSCHPDRGLDPARPLVVFPSNATLSARAHGMAESTLRRHLAALVRSGLILRRDSPNGKRYALRGAAGQQAFGFDLRPLLSCRAEIEAQADMVEAEAEALAARRLTLVLRHRDIAAVVLAMPEDMGETLAQLAEVRTLLRRTASVGLLDAIETLLSDLTDTLAPALTARDAGPGDAETAKSSTAAAHSDRHIQDQHKDSFESEGAGADCSGQERSVPMGAKPEVTTRGPHVALTDSSGFAAKISAGSGVSPPTETVSLCEIKAACPEALSFSQVPVHNWQDMVQLADSLHPHLGVSPDLWARACHALGRIAAAAVLCLLMERMPSLRSLPAYLGGVLKRSRSVPFSLRALIGWTARGKLTAVNQGGVAVIS